MKKIIIVLIILVAFSEATDAQDKYMTPTDYVAMYKDIAIREMKRMGVPAAISLAQGILETENGNSDLVKKSNNHFGIKCKSSWTAGSVSHDDDARGECFRAYKNAEDSYRDHSNYLRGNERYAFLFKLDPRDYKAWAYGLRKAGYATNPRYSEILIKNIEDNNLEQYSLAAAGAIPKFDASKYMNDPEDNDITDTLKREDQSNNDSNINRPLKLTINGCRALFVVKGTSLLAVATQNNINLNHLLDINDIIKDGLLDKDQYIFLEKKKKEGDRDYYIAQEKETLYDIAQKNGIMLQNLYDYNKVSSADHIYPGTKILLKPASKENITQPSSKKDQDNVLEITSLKSSTHIVEPKENLYSISKKYNISMDQLKEWNNLKDNNIHIGQQLIISK